MPPRKRAQSAPKTEDETLEPLVDEHSVPEASAEAKPERNDLQAVDLPCPKCFPNGWPEGSFAVGCEHGSWIRD